MQPFQEIFVSYAPQILLHRLALRPEPLKAPIQERLEAAVLFTDISGFTALSERLAQRGPDGAEELRRSKTSCFSMKAPCAM
jgi:class 3 adenylate cyclase